MTVQKELLSIVESVYETRKCFMPVDVVDLREVFLNAFKIKFCENVDELFYESSYTRKPESGIKQHMKLL